MRIYAWARYHAVVTLAHVQSNPFYHPFYPDVTHVRKDTRPSPAFSVLQATESWAGPGNEASVDSYVLCHHICHSFDVCVKHYTKFTKVKL